jgi:hypothetical protein
MASADGDDGGRISQEEHGICLLVHTPENGGFFDKTFIGEGLFDFESSCL